MKKITFLLCLMLVSLGYAQTDLETFEGPAPTIAVANATTGTAANIVANPDASVGSGNESATVLEFITGDAGDPWQQAELTFQGDYLDLTPGISSTMTIDVYSMEAFDVLVRVTNGVVSSTDGTGVADSAADAIHGGTGWETLTFDFDDPQDTQGPGLGIYGKIFIFNLWDANDSGSGAGTWACNPFGAPSEACPATTRYYDNLNGVSGGIPETCSDGQLNNGEVEIDCGGPNCSACPNPPAAAPTTPPNRAAADVISVYSNAYATAPTDGFQTFGGAVVSEIDYSGNTIQAVTTPDNGSGLQYQYFGVSPQFLDLSLMSNMHIDFYFEGTITDVDTVILVIAQYSDGTNIQKTFNLNTLAAGTWHEMDFAFADFNLNATNARDEIQQVIVQVAGPNGSQVGPLYFDNLYFHNNQVLSTESFETTEFRAYPNPTNGNWNISGKSIITSVAVYDILGKQVINMAPIANEAAIDASSLNSGIYFARIEGVNGSKTIKLIKE